MRRLLVAVIVSAVVGSVSMVASAAPSSTSARRYRAEIFSAVTVKSDIVYGDAVDQNGADVVLKLDLYQPKGDTVSARPAVVWVHGGSFSGGDKTSPELVDEANDLARKGYVNVSINYRLAPQGCLGTVGVSCVEGIVQAALDAQTAVRFLRANAKRYRIDPTRIAIGGSSAGAITALNVGYTTNPGSGSNPGFSSSVEAVQSLSGAAILTTPMAGGAPAIFFHGTADNVVPYAWAQTTVQKAKAAGLVARFISYAGDGHVPYVQHRDDIIQKTTNFFYTNLDLAHAQR